MTTDLNDYELAFPCEYPVKLIGLDQDDFFEFAFAVLARHIPDITRSDLTSRASDGGKYLAISTTFVAQSREQVDAMYADIGSLKRFLVSM